MSRIDAFGIITLSMAISIMVCLSISDEHPAGAIGFGVVVGFVVGLIGCSIANHFMTKNKRCNNSKEV